MTEEDVKRLQHQINKLCMRVGELEEKMDAVARAFGKTFAYTCPPESTCGKYKFWSQPTPDMIGE